MVPYFGKHGAKQYIHGKPIKFVLKLWVMTTQLGYWIQLAGKDSILQEYENIGLGVGASVVAKLVSKLHVMLTSNYHVDMDNYFTSSITETLEYNGSCCNRNGVNKPNEKCTIATYGKTEQRESWIIRCGF